MKFGIELADEKEKTIKHVNLTLSIEGLNRVAVKYFTEELVRDFKGMDMAEIVARWKSTLDRSDQSAKFYRQAVFDIKEDA